MRSTLLASTLLLSFGLVGCDNAKKMETEPPAVSTPPPAAEKGAMEGKPAMDGPAATPAPAEKGAMEGKPAMDGPAVTPTPTEKP